MSNLEDLCNIGPSYQSTGRRDTGKLAAAVELFRGANPPSPEDLLAVIKTIGGCADGWMEWSDNKGWTPAWHFSDNGEESYTIGLFAEGRYSEEQHFDDPDVACSHFIQKDIEDYGRMLDARRAKG